MKTTLLVLIMFILIINLGMTIKASKVIKSYYTSCKQDEDIGGGECKE